MESQKEKTVIYLNLLDALCFKCLSTSYWGEAVLTAVYLINRVISGVLGNTSPIKSMLSHFPSAPILQNLKTRVFGCVAFVHVHKQYRNKLDPRAIMCIFLGYAPNKRGYKCYHPPNRNFFCLQRCHFS
ncbi:hypothetical protein QL285_058852 [Trifolium repens]|nr:hypothetical protein QL285_058852 [Trifolium repens]